MPNVNEATRRRLAWVAALAVLVGVAGWFVYRAVAESRREVASQREDSERLRTARYEDVLKDLEALGEAGDAPARDRCRHAIELLATMEPDRYRVYRQFHPAPGWMDEPPAAKR